MKFAILKLSLICCLVIATSCSKDEKNTAPEIKNVETGSLNSGFAYVDGDLKIGASLAADAGIANISLKISQASSLISGQDDVFQIDTVFTDGYKDKQSIVFNEHFSVPANTPAGTYYYQITLTDAAGAKTNYASTINIKAAPASDNHVPSIAIEWVPADSQRISTGYKVRIKGKVMDQTGLSHVFVSLVKNAGELADSSKVTTDNSMVLLNNHKFENIKDFSFDASMTIGVNKDNDLTPKSNSWSAGGYYLIVKAKGVDQEKATTKCYHVLLPF